MKNVWTEYKAVKEYFPIGGYVTVQDNVYPIFRISKGPHRIKGYYIYQNANEVCLELDAERPTIVVSGYCFLAEKP